LYCRSAAPASLPIQRRHIIRTRQDRYRFCRLLRSPNSRISDDNNDIGTAPVPAPALQLSLVPVWLPTAARGYWARATASMRDSGIATHRQTKAQCTPFRQSLVRANSFVQDIWDRSDPLRPAIERHCGSKCSSLFVTSNPVPTLLLPQRYRHSVALLWWRHRRRERHRMSSEIRVQRKPSN